MSSVGYASVALWIALSPANVAFAKRIHVPSEGKFAERAEVETDGDDTRGFHSLFEHEEEAEVGGATAPRFATDSVLEFEVNKCTLRHMEAFQRGLSGCSAAVSPVEAVDMALETQVVRDLIGNVNGPLRVGAEDEAYIRSALSYDGVAEDHYTIATCVEGYDFVECVKQLHPPTWLVQRWYIMRLLEELTGDENEPTRAAYLAKLQIYRQATHSYGFALTRTRNICTEELSNPMEDQVRMCILNDAVPDFLENPNSQFSSTQNFVYTFHMSALAREEGYDMSNSTSRGLALRNWLLQYWRYRDEQYAFTQFAMRGFQRQCSVSIDTARAQKRIYKHAIQGTLFSIHRRSVPYCEERVQSPIESQGFLNRISTEVTTVCDLDSCTELPGVMAPEGFACDLRRAARQGRNLALGSTAGAIAGLALVLAVPVLGVGVVGLVAAEGIAPSAFVAAGLAFPGKGPAIVTGAALGSQELRPSCMAFPLICRYSAEEDRCEVVLSERQAASGPSNPFSSGPDALPFTGFKCVPHGEEAVALAEHGISNFTVSGLRHAASTQTRCSQVQCTPVDAVIEGPKDPVTGFQLFGRAGFRAEDGGVYNCLNTNASVHSSLPQLDVLPHPSDVMGTTVNNAENRAQLLRMYLEGR